MEGGNSRNEARKMEGGSDINESREMEKGNGAISFSSQELQDIILVFNKLKADNKFMMSENETLKQQVTELKEVAEKHKSNSEHWKSLLLNSSSQAEIKCECVKGELEPLHKKISVLEEENRNLILSRDREDSVVQNTCFEYHVKCEEYRNICTKQRLEIKRLQKEVQEQKNEIEMLEQDGLLRESRKPKSEREKLKRYNQTLQNSLLESNMRYVKLQRDYRDKCNEASTELSKYKSMKEEKEKIIKSLRCEIQRIHASLINSSQSCIQMLDISKTDYGENLQSMSSQTDECTANIEALEVENQINLALIQPLNTQVALSIDETFSKNIEEELINKAAGSEIEIRHLENISTKVSEEFELWESSSDFECADITDHDSNETDTNSSDLNQMYYDALLNEKCAEINTLKKVTKDSNVNKTTAKRPLEQSQSDSLTDASATKKGRSSHSSRAVSIAADNKVVTHTDDCDSLSNNLPEEDDSCDSNASCDVFSLLNSNKSSWLKCSRQPLSPLSDIAELSDGKPLKLENIVSKNDEILSSSTNVIKKNLDKQCSDILCSTKELSSEINYVTKMESPMYISHANSVADVNEKIDFGIEKNSKDENSSAISLSSKEAVMAVDNRCSKVVCSTAENKLVESVAPEIYTVPNMKPKRIAHEPKTSNSFLSDNSHLVCVPLSNLPKSSQRRKKVNKLQKLRKKFSKSCATLWDRPLLNDLVDPKTKTDICKKPSYHKSLPSNVQSNIIHVPENSDSKQLPAKQNPLSAAAGKISAPDSFKYTLECENAVTSVDLYESEMINHPKEKSIELSFDCVSQSSQVKKHNEKYECIVPEGESNAVLSQENEKTTSETSDLCVDRNNLLVPKIKDQNCTDYSVQSTVNSTYSLETKTICKKSQISDSTSDSLKHLLSDNLSNSDFEISALSSDMKCKEFEKQDTSLAFKVPMKESENISKDFNKLSPLKFSFYTSNKNVGEYDIDVNISQEVSFDTLKSEVISACNTTTECNSTSEKYLVRPFSPVKIAGSNHEACEASQVTHLSHDEIAQRNRDAFTRLVGSYQKPKIYNSFRRFLDEEQNLLDAFKVVDTLEEIDKPNINSNELLAGLEHVDPTVLFACTIKTLEGQYHRETWNTLFKLYLELRRGDIPSLLDIIHLKVMLLRRVPLPLYIVRNLCNFYVKLSLSINDYVRLEALVLDSVYCLQRGTSTVLAAVLRGWSDYLPHATVANNDPWFLVLIHSVFNVKTNCKNPLLNAEEVKKKLETVYGYQRGATLTEILKVLFDKLKANKLRKLESSFLMLSKRVSWFQSYTYIIHRKIFPIIDAWIKGDRVLSDEAMAMLIRLLGYMARSINVKNGKQQIQTITRKLQRLCNVNSMPQIISRALFSALVCHGKQDFEGVLDYVLNWKWGLENLDVDIRSFLTYKKLPFWYEKFKHFEGKKFKNLKEKRLRKSSENLRGKKKIKKKKNINLKVKQLHKSSENLRGKTNLKKN